VFFKVIPLAPFKGGMENRILQEEMNTSTFEENIAEQMIYLIISIILNPVLLEGLIIHIFNVAATFRLRNCLINAVCSAPADCSCK
jgi:hypothetical protein